MEVIYQNDWMEILKNGEEYIIKYNSGDLINSIREIKVSEEEAARAQRSEAEADRIIVHHQNIELFGENYMDIR